MRAQFNSSTNTKYNKWQSWSERDGAWRCQWELPVAMVYSFIRGHLFAKYISVLSLYIIFAYVDANKWHVHPDK